MNPALEGPPSPAVARPIAASRHPATTLATAVLAYAVLFAALFAPGWMGKVFGPGDGAFFFHPAYHAPWALWTDTLFGGYPLFGDPQIFLWYPPALVLRALGVGYDGFAISGYVLCGASAFALALALTGSRLAAALAGLVYALSGFTVVHAVHPTMVHAAAWIPAALAAIELLRRRGGPGWIAATSASVALLWLAGAPQIATYGSVVVLAWTLSRARLAPRRAAFLGAAAVAALLGAGLAAVQLLPAAELSRQSVRESLTYADFTSNAYRVKHLVTFVLPRFFGGGDRPYFGPPDVDLLAYFGIPALLLAAAAVRRRGVSGTAFFTALAVAGIVLSLGRTTPAARLLYATPVLNLFRGATRHFVEVALALSMLAAFGVVALEAAPARARRAVAWAALAVALAVGVVAVLAGRATRVPLPDGFSRLPWRNEALGVPLLFTAGSVAVLLAWHRLPRPAAAALLLAVAFADLAAFARSCAWTLSPPEQVLDMPPALAPVRDELRRDHARLIPLDGFWDPMLGGNLARLWDVPSLAGYSVLVSKRVEPLLAMDPNGRVLDRGRLLDPAGLALDLMAARYVLAPASDGTAWIPPGRLEPVGRVGPDLLLLNPRAMPRAWLVGRAVLADDATALAALRTGRLPDGGPFSLGEVAIVDRAVALDGAGHGDEKHARVVSASPAVLEVDTNTPQAALLVTSDPYDPGWRALVDGNPAPVVRTNYAVRGVAVPAGRHRVRFELAPESLWVGGIASVASTAILAGLLVAAALRARRGAVST
jgi:hypothetical protein